MAKVPEYKETKKPIPPENTEEKPVPEANTGEKPVPEYVEKETPHPQPGHPENIVQFGDEMFEIKPTKVKYQRDRTAAFYRILEQMPLVDILALQDGILDPERSSDKMLFDWLVAVTDNSRLVAKYYDKLDSDVIEQILHIFCRLNHIDEREERKNRAAQAMTKA